MSKQLTISVFSSVLAMSLFALSAISGTSAITSLDASSTLVKTVLTAGVPILE